MSQIRLRALRSKDNVHIARYEPDNDMSEAVRLFSRTVRHLLE